MDYYVNLKESNYSILRELKLLQNKKNLMYFK